MDVSGFSGGGDRRAAEGLPSPRQIFLVIFVRFLISFKTYIFFGCKLCRFIFRVEMVLWDVLC